MTLIGESHPIVSSHPSPGASQSPVNSARVNYPAWLPSWFPTVISRLGFLLLLFYSPFLLLAALLELCTCEYLLISCLVVFPIWLTPLNASTQLGFCLLRCPLSLVLQLVCSCASVPAELGGSTLKLSSIGHRSEQFGGHYPASSVL